MNPYYAENGITIYQGDCRDILSSIEPSDVSLVLADPPYGVNERTDRAAAGRGKSPYALMTARDFPPIYGDDEPFDPRHLLRFSQLVLWGANHYADKLPSSPSWIVWDKLDGLRSKRSWGFNDNGDCELAWSNLGGPVRIIPHQWVGLIRASEKERHLHPTQKPVVLMELLIEQFTEPNDLILVPYMGSGPEIVAARKLGRRAIGIEIEERYCEIAVQRLAQGVLDFA